MKQIMLSFEERNAVLEVIAYYKADMKAHLNECPDSILKKDYERNLPFLETTIDKLRGII